MRAPRTIHSNLLLTLSCAGAALTLIPSAIAGATIAEIAPPSTIFIAGTNNFTALHDAFKRAGVMDIWDDPSIQSWIMSGAKDSLEKLEGDLDDLGFKLEDLAPPQGPAGLAVFIDPTAVDETDRFQMIAIADFGAEADNMSKFLTATLDEAERKGEVNLSDETYRNVTIYTAERIEADEPAVEDEDDMEWDWEGQDEAPNGPFAMDKVMYAWSGSSLVYGTNLDAIQDSIDHLAGQAIKSIADDQTYLDALAMVGKQEAFAVARTEPIFTMMEREEAAMGGGPMTAIMKATGLRDIHALSMGMTFDTPGAVSQWTLAGLVPHRAGIFELFENPAQAFTPPSFAGGDAMSLAAFQFDFAGVVPLARKIIAELPPQMQEGANQMLPQVEMMAGPILANLGPRVYSMQSISRPFSATSQQMLFAIQAKDEAQLRQTIAGFAPMMQFQSRDFMGGQIWAPASTMPGVPEISLGIAAGHFFVGPTNALESAIRTAADANAPRLANEARVKKALASLPAQGLGYTWSDLKQGMEYMKWSFENQEKILREQMAANWGDDPEFAPFIEEEIQNQMANMPDFMKHIPNLDPVYKVLGDMVSEYHFTDQGVVMKGSLLKAGK
ncbi:MAG: hypothetical protein KDA20_10850 [Phycisphaerales bacterium]|nr:hypothetical protein [Phycisphaerales bacterium]